MKKRSIALLMVFSLLMVFLTPQTSMAAPPWWPKFKKILKADLVGAAEGYLETGSGWGALAGGVLGSLKEGLQTGDTGGSGQTDESTVPESIGLHHNLAMKYITEGIKVSDLNQDIINKRLGEYILKLDPELEKVVWSLVENESKRIQEKMYSGEELSEFSKKTILSDELRSRFDGALKILDEGGDNPRETVAKASAFLKAGIEDEVLKAQQELLRERGLKAFETTVLEYGRKGSKHFDTMVLCIAISSSVLENSLEYWIGDDFDLGDEYVPMLRKPGWLKKLVKVILADVEGFIDGYDQGGLGQGIAEGVISSTDAGQGYGAGHGNWWDDSNSNLPGALHNQAIVVAYDSEDKKIAIQYFLKQNNIGFDEEKIKGISECIDPKGCTPSNPLEDWLKNIQKIEKPVVTPGFIENMAKLLADRSFETDEILISEDTFSGSVKTLLKDAAKASDTEIKLLKVDELKKMEEQLASLGKPYDIIYASLFTDLFFHSMGYWSGEALPDKFAEDPLNGIDKFMEKFTEKEGKEEDKGGPISISLTIGSNSAVVNGVVHEIDVKPIIIDNRTLVPFRFIGEALNAKIGWIAEEREVTYELGEMELSLFIDKTRILVNGKEQEIDVKPIIMNDRTLVPIRVISETLGFEVGWNEKTRKVSVFSK